MSARRYELSDFEWSIIGAQALYMLTVRIMDVTKPDVVVVRSVLFEESVHLHAGCA